MVLAFLSIAASLAWKTFYNAHDEQDERDGREYKRKEKYYYDTVKKGFFLGLAIYKTKSR